MFSAPFCSRAALATFALAALGATAHGQAGSLYIGGIHTNAVVTWSLDGNSETTYAGGLYGTFTSGAQVTTVDPMFCIDLEGQIGLPTTFNATLTTSNSAAGWLVAAFGTAAMNDTVKDTALQLAIWEVQYDPTDLTHSFSNGRFQLSNDGNGGNALSQANLYLAALGTKTWTTYQYAHAANQYGQTQIAAVPGGPHPNLTSTPGPVGGLVFLGGLLRRRRRASR